jgi:tetratricopeptide (TPR) repeat protein
MMSSARFQRWLVRLLLTVAVIAVYAPVVRYDFIALDDAQYVRDNEHINHGFTWSGIHWVFKNVVAGNWHPITMLSHMADCQVYGLYAGGHHFTNVLFHLANTLLLFQLLLKLTENRSPSASQIADGKNQKSPAPPKFSNLWPCALVAALFGLHPLHVESVAWIAERKDVLSAFFGFLTLWCYAEYAKNSARQSLRPKVFYLLALLSYSLGLMAKPMLVTLPFVLLLLDYWPLRRILVQETPAGRSKIASSAHFQSWVVLEKIPFLLLAGIFSVIAFLVQKQAGAVIPLQNFPLSARLANAMMAYAHYLEKTFWPDSLAMLYPYHHWTTGQIEGATAWFAGLSLMAVMTLRRRPYIFVGWFWFVGMLVPVIGLVQVGLQAMADRYTYLPLIGIFIALAWGLADLAAAATLPGPSASAGHQNSRRTWPCAWMISGVVVAVLCFTVAGAVQVRYWKNSETLFGHAVRVTDNNTVAHYVLGALYDSQGKTDAALSQFMQAIQDDPGNVKARCGAGYILYGQGRWDEALEQYQTALGFAPDLAKAHFGLAEVLMKEHRLDEATGEYQRALQSDPNIAEAHYQMAAIADARGDAVSAISHLQAAVQLAPDWALALNNLAWIRATQPEAKLRDGAEATRLAMRAVILTGKSDPNMLDTLAAAYAETGRFTDAVATAKSAIQYASIAGQTNLVNEIGACLKLYQAQQPDRE